MHRKRIPGFDELSKPLTAYEPKYYYYKVLSALLRTFGCESRGIELGYKYGFDSGIIMNYIYENVPHGRGFWGKAIDHSFLNQTTCKAFRSIRQMQSAKITEFLNERKGQETYIADLASGKADYLYDVLVEDNSQVNVLLRDISENTLNESKRMAERLGIADRIEYQIGNALDPGDLATIKPSPDLVVEVGLYGIIHDDDLIKKHFHDLISVLSPGALLFNVQTYNEQIELIARALINQEGEPCVWHLRSVDEVIAWAEDAGFKDPDLTMDPYGIYAVVLMRT